MGTATIKQISFINTLFAERSITPEMESGYRAVMSTPAFDGKAASNVINALLLAPRRPKTSPVSAFPTVYAEAQNALGTVDLGFYAIPAGWVSAQPIDLHGNDYLFLRVRSYGGKLYMSRIFGSFAALRYQRLSSRDALTLVKVIREDMHAFQENWHKVSGNCGRCNSPLTDKVSRETGFGPECRKIRAAFTR